MHVLGENQKIQLKMKNYIPNIKKKIGIIFIIKIFPPPPHQKIFPFQFFFTGPTLVLNGHFFLPQKLFFSKKCCFPLEIRKIFEFPKKIFLEIFFKNYYFYIWDILINFYFHDDAQNCCFPLEIWKIFEFSKKYFQKYFSKITIFTLGTFRLTFIFFMLLKNVVFP